MNAPLFGLVALILLFFKLPGVPELFGILNCKSCSTTTPYLPMVTAAYFSAFVTCILCFPSLPARPLKYAGIVWALGLAICLTYLSPTWCWICLGAHTCHVAMWIFWRPVRVRTEHSVGLKLSLIFTSALAVMALFSTLNVTFLVYGLQFKNPTGSLVKKGSKVKPFALKTIEEKALSNTLLAEFGGTILNFVSSNCPYCKEQVPELDSLALKFQEQGFRFVTISQHVVPELQVLGPNLEWAEDQKRTLFELFGIEGYPTMVLIDSKGVVKTTVAGATSNLEKEVTKELKRCLLPL